MAKISARKLILCELLRLHFKCKNYDIKRIIMILSDYLIGKKIIKWLHYGSLFI